MNIVKVQASSSYEVKIGSSLLSTIGTEVAAITNVGIAVIVSDSNVWPLYGAGVEESLKKAGYAVISYVFSAGESSKNGTTYLSLLNFLAENHISRSDCLIALGGGVVGQGALSVLYALGAKVTVMDINVGVLRMLSDRYNQKIDTMVCTKEAIAALLPQTDMVINCVKWPKERTDFLIDKEMLKTMEPGSVLVDISNDDPGAIESSHETHHDDPRYVVNGVVHYCVSNIPGAVAHSPSVALAAETLPMLLNVMNNGLEEACVRDGYIRRCLTAYKGYLTHEETSAIQTKPWIRPEDILGIADRNLDFAPPATTTRSNNFIKL